MPQPRIQNEPGPTVEPPEEVDPIVPFDQMTEEQKVAMADAIEDLQERAQDLVASGQAADLGEAVEMIRYAVEPTAAERRAARGPRQPKAPRLREDLFGNIGGIR